MKQEHRGYVVRWEDSGGQKHSKEYMAWDLARKAKNWLLKQGANYVDIAVILSVKAPASDNSDGSDGSGQVAA